MEHVHISITFFPFLSLLYDGTYLIEYDTLVRLGIDDPQSYVHTKYKERSDLIMLKSCCVGPSVVSEISANVEDTVLTQCKWIDVMVRSSVVLQRMYIAA